MYAISKALLQSDLEIRLFKAAIPLSTADMDTRIQDITTPAVTSLLEVHIDPKLRAAFSKYSESIILLLRHPLHRILLLDFCKNSSVSRIISSNTDWIMRDSCYRILISTV